MKSDKIHTDGEESVPIQDVSRREDDAIPLLPDSSGALVTIIDNDAKALHDEGFIFQGTKPLGIQYGLQNEKVIIQKIALGGSVEKWNQENVEKVRVGDEIVAIFQGGERIDVRLFSHFPPENNSHHLQSDHDDGPIELANEKQSLNYTIKLKYKGNKASLMADYLLSNTNPDQAITLELVHSHTDHEHDQDHDHDHDDDDVIDGQTQKKKNERAPRDLGDRYVYSVSLSKPLGIRIDRKQTKHGNVVVVSKIQPTGAAADWNKTVLVHAQRIRIHDRVIAFYDHGGNRVDVSQWPGREIADRIHGLEDDSVTLEFERTENDGACACCIIL